VLLRQPVEIAPEIGRASAGRIRLQLRHNLTQDNIKLDIDPFRSKIVNKRINDNFRTTLANMDVASVRARGQDRPAE
jgi:hypothetical protein